MLVRLPPANPACEQAVLGAVLANNRAFDLCGTLQSEHFADPLHQELWEAIGRRIRLGQSVSPLTLKAFVENTGLCDDVGGVGYLVSLLSAMVAIQVVPEYARAIQDCALRRRLLVIAEELEQRAYGTDINDGDGFGTASLAVTQIETAIAAAGSSGTSSIGEATAAALSLSEAAASGKSPAILTGIAGLDSIWGGLHCKETDFLAARTSTGKTTLALQIARNVAAAGHMVGLISAEISKEQLGMMNVCSLAGMSADHFRNQANWSQADAERVIRAQKHLMQLPIDIADVPGIGLSELLGQMRIWKRRDKCRLVIVDHRSLIGRDSHGERMGILQWYPYLHRTLRIAAKTLDISLLLLVQISREILRRDDTRPRISDIEYAGEQDADNICMLYRPELHIGEYPVRKTNETAEQHGNRASEWYALRASLTGKAEAIMGKRRFGKPGIVPLLFDGTSFNFRDVPYDGPS